MAGKFRTAFFSFPGEPNDLFATIGSAAETAAGISDKISIKTWPEMDIFGAALADEVRNEIRVARRYTIITPFALCNLSRGNTQQNRIKLERSGTGADMANLL
jgi:hypothetical protein